MLGREERGRGCMGHEGERAGDKEKRKEKEAWVIVALRMRRARDGPPDGHGAERKGVLRVE